MTIVLIDDDSDDIELMQEAIAEVDPHAVCMPFTRPDEAIKALVGTRLTFVPNHIFIDHNMPEMTGLECVKVLRSMKEFDLCSITVISTSMDEMDAKLFSSAGANFTFQKPVSLKGYFNLLRIVFELDAV
ncbi:MAG: response regulator [Chryseolinea sp.]